MSKSQPALGVEPGPARTSARRKLWLPSNWNGNFRLPGKIADRIHAEIQHFKNRDAVYRLFVLLVRFHAGPQRLFTRGAKGFVIDRRALSGVSAKMQADPVKRDRVLEYCGLSEDRVRGAIKTLLRIGAIQPVGQTDGSGEDETRRSRRPAKLYRFSDTYFEMLTPYARRRGGDRSRRIVGLRSQKNSNSPKEPTKRSEVGHVGEERRTPPPRLLPDWRARLGVSPQSAPDVLKASSRPALLSDAAVWSVIDAELKTYLAPHLYWEAQARLTPAMREEAIVAQRQRAGGGLATLSLLLRTRP